MSSSHPCDLVQLGRVQLGQRREQAAVVLGVQRRQGQPASTPARTSAAAVSRRCSAPASGATGQTADTSCPSTGFAPSSGGGPAPTRRRAATRDAVLAQQLQVAARARGA